MPNKHKPEYLRRLRAAGPVQTCCSCRLRDSKSNLEPHHPHGRDGANILIFEWCHAWCHRLAPTSIHNRPALAKARGLYHSHEHPPQTSPLPEIGPLD